MTRDEALKLDAGPELDAVVAEVIFGWKWVQPPKFDYDGPLPSQGMVLAPPGFDCDHFVWPNRGIVPPTYFTKGRKFSTDIAAAWQVVEKMHADGWTIDVRVCSIDAGGGCRCTIICNYGPCERHGHTEHTFHGASNVRGDTAPLAVCRAVVAAVMKN